MEVVTIYKDMKKKSGTNKYYLPDTISNFEVVIIEYDMGADVKYIGQINVDIENRNIFAYSTSQFSKDEAKYLCWRFLFDTYEEVNREEEVNYAEETT